MFKYKSGRKAFYSGLFFSPFFCMAVLLLLFLCACHSVERYPDIVDDTNVAGVLITRSDGYPGTMNVFINGRMEGRLGQGGKWGKKLQNGRHTISVVYNKRRSEVIDFRIDNSRQNFKATVYLNDNPGLLRW